MAQSWTTTELLAAIREDGRIPDDTPDATDVKLLRLADRILATRFVPVIRKARSEYYVSYKTISLTAERAAYNIPIQAATNSVREVFLVDSSGREYELSPATLADRHGFTSRPGTPQKYAILDDQVVLLPAPQSSTQWTLKIVFEARPSTLVLPESCATIATKTRMSATVMGLTASNISPGTFATGLALNAYVDIVKATPPFSVLFYSAQWTATVSLTPQWTVDGDTYRGEVGDYLCTRGESPVPHLPPEGHPTLAYAVIAEWLRPIDEQGCASFEAKTEAGLLELSSVLSPRQQGRQIKMRGSSLMRRGSVGRGNGGTFDDFNG